MRGCLRFSISYFEYCQIWLNKLWIILTWATSQNWKSKILGPINNCSKDVMWWWMTHGNLFLSDLMDGWWFNKIPLHLLLANEAGPMPVLVQCQFSSW
jgi:hypothetical protein